MKVSNLFFQRVLLCLLATIAFSGVTFNAYSQAVRLGDVNNNNQVDIIDAMLIAQFSAGMSPAVFNAAAADVNCDGTINIVDALMTARYSAGVITALTCQPTLSPTITPPPTPTPTTTPTGTRTPMPTSGGTAYPTPIPTGTGAPYTPPPANTSTPGPSVTPGTSPTLDPHFFYFSYDDSASTAAVELVKYKLNNNQKPDPSLARPWEFLNYEKITPTATTKIGLFDVSLGLWERDALKKGYAKEYKFGAYVASPVITKEQRKNIVLTLVMDISGSMSSYATQVDSQPITRMELMKYGLLRLGNSLKEGDVINLVTFSTESWINHQGLVYPQHAATYTDFINSLQPTNSTNLNLGLNNGYTAALATYDPTKMNRLILLTDAYANTGEINPTTISQQIVINGQEGIYFSALGISADVNEAFINQLTEAGKGAYFAITTRTDAQRAFEDRFIALLAVAARDVRFRLDYPLSMTRDLDSTGSEESSTNPEEVQPTNFSYNTKQYFYEGFLTQNLPATADEQFTLSVFYKDPNTGEEKTEKITRTVGEILGLDNACIRDAEVICLFTKLIGLTKPWSATNAILNTYYSSYSSPLFTEYKDLMYKYLGNALSAAPATINFGQVAVGATAVKPLSIINGEAVDVRVLKVYFDAVTLQAERMSHNADVPVTLRTFDSYDFAISLNTSASGSFTGTLTIETDSLTTPTLTVRCTATVGTTPPPPTTVPPPYTLPPTPTPTLPPPTIMPTPTILP